MRSTFHFIFANHNIIKIIPNGDFYKKNKAVEIVEANVAKGSMRRKMLRLIELIPKKKSLHLAQKALNGRDVESVMTEFYKLRLSPVTISKRQEIKYLKNLYDYL